MKISEITSINEINLLIQEFTFLLNQEVKPFESTMDSVDLTMSMWHGSNYRLYEEYRKEFVQALYEYNCAVRFSKSHKMIEALKEQKQNILNSYTI